MVNIDSILKKTKQFSKSEKGQTKVRELREKAFDENKTFGTSKNGGIVSKEDFRRVAQELLNKIYNTCDKNPLASESAVAAVRKVVETEKTISNVKKSGKGTYRVQVEFNKNALRRNSLINSKTNERTGKGIDNIIALLNNGMDTQSGKAPWGLWETHNNIFVHALSHREPLNFMQDGTKEFFKQFKKKYEIKSLDIGEEYKN